ncbi:4-hydroxy-tetrahydrodipicolinate synthase [Pseudalkalibacillus hwajinpoensis]|uniref:4-hydroxy-tetrahydrodipicolinate synthase n=1 Tax=Guptibacillus hwajinpoensis TaxID=208199 RepID=UPI001CD63E4C|nr:4-hydroxy-tetrahydrodipicolinate synthase [Pseudalkalibacillus hwajinpoensis]MCA0990250.1 4-hydroxy-tetrahydrodipicolinate synthase [Pseudalkalibacillus hwajinpoensis]
MNFGKVLTAMVTPFDRKGYVDFAKTEQLINYLINNGTDGLVVAGTTGESPTLSSEEKVALFKHSVKAADGRVPIIAGTGSNNTHASIELTKKAEAVGVDAIMIVAPYYSKPGQKGLYEHFKAIAESTKLPVMIYNIPGRSVVNMTADTIVELSKISNIVSVKESSGDLDQITDIITRTEASFSVYSGDDGLTLPILSVGGDGVISVASHVLGNEMQQMVSAYESGEVKEAASIHQRILPIMNELFKAPSPSPVKTALQLKGMDVGSVRLPMVPLTAEERSSLAAALNK